MNSSEIVLSIIGVLGTLSSILFAYLAFKKNEKKDTEQDAKAAGVLMSDIGYIKSSIDRIEQNLDKLEERYSSLSNKIVKIEEGLENVNRRITEHINDTSKHLGGRNHE